MKNAIMTVLPVIIGLAITVGLAAIGEPQSAWFVCDILGVEVCE